MAVFYKTLDALDTDKITISSTLYSNPNNLSKIVYFDYCGTNNQLIIDEGVIVQKVQIEFEGACANATIHFKKNSLIRGNFTVAKNCSITIGEKARMTRHSQVVAKENTHIRIGNECLISNTTILSTDHHGIYDRNTGERINLSKSVYIGDNVWLGQNVLVLKGAKIGTGSIIGANSSVIKSIPSYSLAAGNPAKVIRENVIWSIEMKDKLDV